MRNIISILVMLVITSVYFFFFDRQNQEISLLKDHLSLIQEGTNELLNKNKELEEKLEIAQSKLEKTKKKKKQKPVSVKKREFLKMMVPPLEEVYSELQTQYLEIKKLLDEGVNNERIESLKKFYKVDSNEKLLIALKPHPKSIALAQGAMESAWGESRFFKEANNLFGIWSFNKNEPRIAAGSQRGDKTIWLKKYSTVKEAIKDYYILLSRGGAFKEFRQLSFQDASVFEIVKKLHRYSEKKDLYGKELTDMIKFNKFTKYDDKPKVESIKNELLMPKENF